MNKTTMKSVLKKILVSILGFQVRRLIAKNKFKIIGVVGSIGKTSTKLAIAKVLLADKKVQYQEGNYNDIVSVPLVFFGHLIPPIWNILLWIKIIIQNEIQIYAHYPYDFVVLELGTDGPNQINQFRRYLHLDIAIVTAITEEHMENFKDLDDVANEEWSISYFSDIVIANKDLCLKIPENIDHKKVVFYGKDFGSLYKIENIEKKDDVFSFVIFSKGELFMEVLYSGVGEVEIYSITASIIIARMFKISTDKIQSSIDQIKGFAGRMQKLEGVKGSIIIDDSYNASPESMKIALNTLYSYKGKQKIAILGMMNELGKISEEEHLKIGKYCDPKKLDILVTIGEDANKFLAKSARENGCEVYEAKDSKSAGLLVLEKIKDDCIILVKGSQNGVFAEEAIKPLLKNKDDVSKLVRQSVDWMEKKG